MKIWSVVAATLMFGCTLSNSAAMRVLPVRTSITGSGAAGFVPTLSAPLRLTGGGSPMVAPSLLKGALPGSLPTPQVQGVNHTALTGLAEIAPFHLEAAPLAEIPQGTVLDGTKNAVEALTSKDANLGQITGQVYDNQRVNARPGSPVDASSFDLPDTKSAWYDKFTGRYETEATKIKKSLELALTNPMAKAIKDNLASNTLYRVERARVFNFVARTIGDNPEKPWETEAAVIFTAQALRDLSPHYLAAKLAGLWARHLYKDQIPQSAEKTYVEGSIFIRVFMALTGSTSQRWVGDLDYWNNGNFEAYKHFYHWIKGFQYDNVRQGPYFKDKIMKQEGDPVIYADENGRATLFQRAQAGEISDAAATRGQEKFDAVVSVERR